MVSYDHDHHSRKQLQQKREEEKERRSKTALERCDDNSSSLCTYYTVSLEMTSSMPGLVLVSRETACGNHDTIIN